MKGAKEAGNIVEKINVSKKKIDYCKGCYYCQTHKGECAIKDDMAEILQKIIDADVLVLSSPVYLKNTANIYHFRTKNGLNLIKKEKLLCKTADLSFRLIWFENI